MKTVQFPLLTLLFLLTLFLPNAFAQDSPQWHLPEGAIARLGKGQIWDVKYSPDGTRLAVASESGVWIYDALTGEELDLFIAQRTVTTLPGPIWSIAYSPNGRLLAGGCWGGVVQLWDAVSGQPKATLKGHTGWVNSVSFSPDGQILASCGSYDGTVRVWDAVSGQPKATLKGHTGWVNSVSFSPDGQTLASAGGRDDNTVRLWDVDTSIYTATLTGHTGDVLSVSFSPDGQTLASAGGRDDRTVRLWDVSTGTHTATLTGHRGNVLNVSFSPDGQTLASGGEDRTVRLWDVASGTHKTTLTGHTGWIYSVAFSPDGQTLASSGREDGTVRLWDVASGTHKTTLTGHTSEVLSVAFSPDGQTLVSSGSEDGVRLWDAVSGKYKTTLTGHTDRAGHTDRVLSVSFSPDGQTLATGSYKKVQLWDAVSGKYKATLTGHASWVLSVSFSPDGQTLTGSEGRTVWLWDTVSGKYKATTLTGPGHTDRVTSIAFSPDGQTLASGGWKDDKTIRLWDTVSGTHKATLTGHTSAVYRVAFSPDSQTLASCGGYGQVHLWDVVGGKHKSSIRGFPCVIEGIAFSPDGSTLIVGGYASTVWLVDVATGEYLKTFKGHGDSINRVAFSPDGRTVASVSRRGTVVLWDVAPLVPQPDQPTTTTRPRNMVRLIYFLPSDRQPKIDIDTQMDTLIKQVQRSYAADMARHGFGRKTFAIETDATGNAVVHHVAGQFTADYYEQEAFSKVLGEVDEQFDTSRNIYLVVVDSGYLIDGAAGKATIRGSEAGGVAIINGIGDLADYGYLASHELRHTFGLAHDFSLDPRGFTPQISKCTAEWLSVHRYFNTGQTAFDEITTIEMLSRRASRVQLQLTDADGLHQVQFLIPTSADDSVQDTQLRSCELLNGSSSSTFEFVATELTGTARTEVTVQVIDVYGNITKQLLPIETDNVVDRTDNVTVSVSPSPVHSPAIGDQLTLSLNITGGEKVAGYQATVEFDTTALRYVESANGDYLSANAFFIPPAVSGNRFTLVATSLVGESNGNGTLATLTFEVIAVKPSTLIVSDVVLSDSGGVGSRPHLENGEILEPPQVKGDVNRDGVVNIQDLVLIVRRIGQTGQNDADINGDDVVNIQDLVLAAGALAAEAHGNTAAAPVLHPQTLEMLTASEVEGWLTQAQQMGLTDPAYLRGIAMLEYLLAVLTPKETGLLPNYPNPFNPETWIPYHLATDADVTFMIYDTRGVLVRQLDLGHQAAGYYTDQNKAAYWDGRNESGESVASGVYFYQLTAGDYSATKRMVIVK